MTWIGDLIEDSRRTKYDKSLATETQVTKQVAKTPQRGGFRQKRFPPYKNSKVFLTFDGERTGENTIEEESEEAQENCTDSGNQSMVQSMDQYEESTDETYDQYHDQEKTPVLMTNASIASGSACVLCQGKHPLTECPEKITVSPNVMKSLMWANHICFGCGEGKHLSRECTTKVVCNICKQNDHPTILHGATWTSAQVNRTNSTEQKADPKKQHNVSFSFLGSTPKK
jgi:hypothetical protein